MIVVGRTATRFMTFVFGGNPNFGTVIKDLLLVVGVVARFVLNNVFTHTMFFGAGERRARDQRDADQDVLGAVWSST